MADAKSVCNLLAIFRKTLIRLLLILSVKSLSTRRVLRSISFKLVNNDDFLAIRVSRAVDGPRVF